MTWDYKILTISLADQADLARQLEDAGNDGWEVAIYIPVVGNRSWIVLKRPVRP